MKNLGGGFWRMFTATAACDLADGIGRTALPLAAASFSRNPVAVSGLLTFSFLPWLLFALPSGALVDRLDRRYAMAAANAVRAVATGVLIALIATGAGSIVTLYVVAFVLGCAETVYDSAVRALLPQVVEQSRLDGANSVLTVEEQLGQNFIGAPLGSALFTVAVAAPFIANGIGFAVAAAVILRLRGNFRPARGTVRTTLRADVLEGVRWLRGHALLRGLTAVSAATCFAQTMTTGVLVLYVLEVLRLPSGDFGLVVLVAGVGAVLGGLATPPLAARFGRPVVLTVGSVVSGAALALMSTTRNGVVATVLFAVESMGVMTWNILTMSLRQALIPAHLFGRVQGAYRTVVWGAIPLGALAGGALASVVGIRTTFLIAGSAMLLLTVRLGLLLARHTDELDQTAPAPVPVLTS